MAERRRRVSRQRQQPVFRSLLIAGYTKKMETSPTLHPRRLGVVGLKLLVGYIPGLHDAGVRLDTGVNNARSSGRGPANHS